jgi:NAD+ synthase (glutamine-hydrolysing)
VRVALGQFNAVVGDMAGNARKMRELYAGAVRANVDLLAFPELAVCGYPPEDLLHKRHFLTDCSLTLDRLAADCPDKTIVVGFAESDRFGNYNSAAVLQGGKVSGTYRKALLPNYGVFDEQRYFRPGTDPLVLDVGGLKTAVTICFDIWNIEWLRNFLINSGPIQMILNISASPFHTSKLARREETINECAREFGCAVAYCNLVGFSHSELLWTF